jgi:hypothetical protein
MHTGLDQYRANKANGNKPAGCQQSMPVALSLRKEALFPTARMRPTYFRRSTAYVNRILKGERPAELPVRRPLKYELVINIKTAKAISLTVLPTLLGTADELLE